MNDYSFTCKGHSNISANHVSTLEIITDKTLTPRGDCIVGVSSSLSLDDLPVEIKKNIRKDDSKIRVIISVNEIVEEIFGYGSSQLLLSSKQGIIIRKSAYICPKTLLVNANKAAADLSREFIKALKNPETTINVQIHVG